jgi:tetrahydromethanopterin S-methyltransferase subunit F
VNEFGAELDRKLIKMSIDSSTDSITRFEDHDVESRRSQLSGRSQSCGAGADY